MGAAVVQSSRPRLTDARSAAQSGSGLRGAVGGSGGGEWDHRCSGQGESSTRGAAGCAATATTGQVASRLTDARSAAQSGSGLRGAVGGSGGGEWDYRCSGQEDLAAELRETKRLATMLMESTERKLEAGAAAMRQMGLSHQASLAAMVMIGEVRVQMVREGGNRDKAGRGASVAWRAFAATARSLGRAGFEDAEAWRRAVGAQVETLWGWPERTCARWEGGEPACAAAMRMQAAARQFMAGRRAARRREQLLVAERRLAAWEAKARRPGHVSAAALAACLGAAVTAAAERRLAVARGLQVREAEVRERRRQREAGQEARAVRAAADALAREAQALEAEGEPDWLREAGLALSRAGADVLALSDVGVASVAEAEGTTRTRRKKAGARRGETIAARREVGQSG